MTAAAPAGGARGGSARPVAAVVDHGAGNLVSIEEALAVGGAETRRVTSADGFAGADLVVLPGVGAAAPAMARLAAGGLVDPLRAWIAADRPFLGICLGLQLLMERSDEDDAETLGIVAGRARRLEGAPLLPHIGWNQVEPVRPHPAFAGIAPGTDFYFVHSYAVVPTDPAAPELVATATHGRPFVAALARGRLLGVQFHPERSGPDGLRLVANVVALAALGTAVRGHAVPVAPLPGGRSPEGPERPAPAPDGREVA